MTFEILQADTILFREIVCNKTGILLFSSIFSVILVGFFWLDLLCPSQQLRSCRDSQFTKPNFFLGMLYD